MFCTAGTIMAVAAPLILISRPAISDNQIPRLLPTPQVIKASVGEQLDTKSIRGFVIADGRAQATAAIDQVNARLKELGQPEIRLLNEHAAPESGIIWLGTKPNAETEKLFSGLPEPKEQGYRLAVTKDRVVILGKDLPGLYYGLVTLSQLILKDGNLPAVTISDWPNLPMRGTYIAEPDPEKKIEYLASLKLNFIVFEYGELYHLDQPAAYARWKKIADTCRKHFIEPIPELQSLGHGQFPLAIDPRCAEGVYREGVRVTAKSGKIVPTDNDKPVADLKIENPGFESNDGWTLDNEGKGFTFDSSEKYSGAASLKIASDSVTTLRAWTNVPCESGCYYDLACYLKIANVAPDKGVDSGAYIEAYGLYDNGGLSAAPLGRVEPITGTKDWTKISCRFYTGDFTRLQIFVRLQSTCGSAWFDDVSLTGVKRDVQILTNAIITESAPIILTDQTGAVRYKEGKDFKIAPGEPLTFGDVWTPSTWFPVHKAPGLEVVAGGKITECQNLILSYDYAPTGSISCCPSEPIYRKIMRDAIHRVIKCMGCKYVHIGHDEPSAFNRDSRCRSLGKSNIELFVDDVNRMRNDAREVNPKVRLMMWDDAVNPYANAAGLNLQEAGPKLPKDVIMCAWEYGYPGGNEKIQKSIDYWTKLGFDITGSPWFDKGNAHYWPEALVEHKDSGHILGSFYTSWLDLKPPTWKGLTTCAQYSWSNTVPFDEFVAAEEGK